MTNNEILRRIKEALNLGEDQISEVFRQIGHSVEPACKVGYFLEADAPGSVECPNIALSAFLEGLIIVLRGVNEKNPSPAPSNASLDNSDILKKLRVALDMHHTDVVTTLTRSGVNPTKSDLMAYFRKKGHPQYRSCSDGLLKAFLTGYKPPRRPRIIR